MSIGTLEQTMQRIEVATEKSPIVVLKHSMLGVKKLDSYFASTCESRSRYTVGSPNVIGIFYNTMDMYKVRDRLLKYLK